MVLQTERLYLREVTQDDFPLLCKHLQDIDVMYAYGIAKPHYIFSVRRRPDNIIGESTGPAAIYLDEGQNNK